MSRALTVSVLLVTTIAVAGCSSSDGSTRVAVTGTNDACTVPNGELPAGKLAFEFTNQADDVNELYVLREDESVVGEVEGVTTGTSRTLNVDLVAGEYLIRCKPGQTGDGFTSEVTVSGEGGTAQKAADRTVEFIGTDFVYSDLDLSDVKAGETIRFVMRNEGKQAHEFEVLDPQGNAIGEVASTEPGEEGSAVLTFDATGDYSYQCILVDAASDKKHTMLGMQGVFSVAKS